MILNPGYYFVHDAQNHSRLQQLYAARSCTLKRIKGRYRGNKILASLIDRPIFTYQYPKKAGKKMVSAIGSDEKAAIDLAFHTVILFQLEISANLPPPMEQGDKADFADLEVPEGFDYIFDLNWEHPGQAVNLKRVLEGFKDLAV
jgi:hypothetical protein